jgi:hypothetical protein
VNGVEHPAQHCRRFRLWAWPSHLGVAPRNLGGADRPVELPDAAPDGQTIESVCPPGRRTQLPMFPSETDGLSHAGLGSGPLMARVQW